jgi:hypothetical protein
MKSLSTGLRCRGPSKLDGMGIPKDAARKVQIIDRLKRLGATDD